MANTVLGLFEDSYGAERAMKALAERGFDSKDVSVVSTVSGGTTSSNGDEILGEGAVSSLTSGVVVGGVLCALVGAGALFLPGGVFVAGPVAGMIAGATAGAATGGVLGAVLSLGVPKEHANIYSDALERGGTLLGVSVEDRLVEEIERLLVDCGAWTVEERPDMARHRGDRIPATTEQAEVQKAISEFDAVGDENEEDRYERFSPAYAFGFSHALDAKFGGRVWAEAEPELREVWERQRPGTWEANRKAIRVGWDRCKVRGPHGGRAELI